MSEVSIEVVYALPGRQVLRRLTLPGGSTVGDAIRASGLTGGLLEIDPARVGIHGKPVSLDATLHDRDRVELYRPLQADPKEIRRARADKKRARK